MKCALLLAKFRNIKKVEIEGDNRTIMKALENRNTCLSWCLIPLFESCTQLCNEIDFCILDWIPRHSNDIAHSLVSMGRLVKESRFL